MKNSMKMVLAFLSAFIISGIIFLLFCYYCIHSGYFSGISHSDMMDALNRGSALMEQTTEKDVVLRQLESEFRDMDFAFWTNGTWMADEDIPALTDDVQIMNAINEQHDICSDYKVAAAIIPDDEGETFLVCMVNRKHYEAFSYVFNMPRAKGMLGKLAVIGIAIVMFFVEIVLYMIQHEYREKEHYEKGRKELISNLSHDLRTPLASVLGYAEMLKNGVYDDETEEKQYIDIIYRKAVYMEKLLMELLEYSRLELGTIRLQKEKMNLAEFVRELLIEYYPVFEKNDYELEVEISDTPVIGTWDREKLGRVFRNLIDNALKYGMDGKKLKITVEKHDKQAVVEIRDFGKGIPTKDISHVTQRFYRADHARNSKKGGMGLGLYIVQEIVKLHDGSVQIESKEMQGTIINLRLPL